MRAFNARTGETETPLNARLIAAVETLLFWDREIGGGAQLGRCRDQLHVPPRDLTAAALSEDFVATYCLARYSGPDSFRPGRRSLPCSHSCTSHGHPVR